MARSVIRRGRMPPEDEERMQKCTVCIESEVEARDVTPHLVTAGILNLEDREEINYGKTRLNRIRRFIDVLIMRGPRALHEFILALETNGYERVAVELRECDGDEERVQRAPVGDRLKKVEDGWEILSRRLTRIESKVEQNSDIPANELDNVKLELHDLKQDLLRKVKSLTKENMKKDEMIHSLRVQLDRKIEDLKQAEKRIHILETKIKELEERMKQEHFEMHGKLDEQSQIIDDQTNKLETAGRILEKQTKAINKQGEKIMRQDDKIQELKLKTRDQENRQRSTDQVLKEMAERIKQIDVNIEKDRRDRMHMPTDMVTAHQTRMNSRTARGNLMVSRNRFQTKPKRVY